MVDILWKVRAVVDQNGRPLFSVDDIALVQHAVIAKCDQLDGLKDGIIEDPRRCRFYPSELICKAGVQNSCLSQAQVQALGKIYSGPITSRGERLFKGGAMPGSEALAIPHYQVRTPDSGLGLSSNFFRYMGFVPAPGPDWKSTEFDFDRDYQRLGMIGSLYLGTNPDLRKFKAAGGKLIMWEGWGDGVISPEAVIDYYETVEKTMGGASATHDFFRLFMVPGMAHCWGGDGAWAIDFLSYLEAWVERGQAPDVMIGAHPKDPNADIQSFPLQPSTVSFTRPMYPYPLQAKYKGTGDPNQAVSFAPVRRH